MHQVNTFIEQALGLDPTTGKPMSFKGLFGDVEAYFGMVETQGRGTLHIHFLIWLSNAPSSKPELEEVQASSRATESKESVVAYVDSIVRNQLPLPLDRHTCSKCGASYSELSDLVIQPKSKQKNRCSIFSDRTHRRVLEPALVYCNACKTSFSSQHILWNILLQGRPPRWPPWERELEASEIDRVAKKEAACRDTMEQAVGIVDDREMIQLALRSEAARFSSRYGLMATPEAQRLNEANAFRMAYCSSEDDPFQNDELTRLIETIPPMVADTRLTREWMDYMVSVIVVLLNQHWWCHTSSCFKASRVTVSDDFCRYNFPRSRKPRTSFGLSGVDLERGTAHEYINGYNYELMASFKCNHDIQILLGGKDTADRIHYCTKYVTKPQKRLDSVVVMALAAFRRRQERETSVRCGDGPSAAADAVSVSRKMVASMVYAMTNRQEIAGPLAALYLYRGSCCYESSGCSFLPLRDIIGQLCSTDNYSCELVDGADSAGSSRFLAVSFRLPFVDANSPEDVRYKHAILSLVLFKPFRELADLIGSTDTSGEQWLHSFHEWEPCRSEFVKRVMNHISDYYCGVQRANAHEDSAAKNDSCSIPEDDANDSCSDDDSLFSVVDFDDDDDADCDDSAAFADPWLENSTASSAVFDSQEIHPFTCPTTATPNDRIAKLLDVFKTHRMLADSAQSTVIHRQHATAPDIFPGVDIIQKWVKNSATDCTLREPSLADNHLWLSFTDVVILEESVRFEADPEWGRGCRSARRGEWLPEFVEIINSRVTGNAQTMFIEWRPDNIYRVAP